MPQRRFVPELLATFLIPGLLLVGVLRSEPVSPDLLHRLLFPALGAYLIVGFGAGKLGFWRWRLRCAVRGVPLLIGPIYSAYLITLWDGSLALAHLIRVHGPVFLIPVMAGFTGAFGVLHDYCVVRFGLAEVYNRSWKRGLGPFRVVLEYAPVYFALIGLTYATLIQITRLSRLIDSVGIVWATLASGVFFAAPFLVYFAYLSRKKGSRLR